MARVQPRAGEGQGLEKTQGDLLPQLQGGTGRDSSRIPIQRPGPACSVSNLHLQQAWYMQTVALSGADSAGPGLGTCIPNSWEPPT